MKVATKHHYKISSRELAKWLIEKGEECWWSVDGETFLMGHLSFPCPGPDLADELAKIDRDLLLQDKDDSNQAKGQAIRAEDLERLADKDDTGNRSFLLSWTDSPPEDLGWLLTEDKEAAQSSSSAACES